MNGDDPWALAISEWRRQFNVKDGDPMLAVLELVRLAVRRPASAKDIPLPPSFEEFRESLELLDRRSKSFVQPAADLISELRRFGQAVERLNHTRLLTQLLLTVLGMVIGSLLGASR